MKKLIIAIIELLIKKTGYVDQDIITRAAKLQIGLREEISRMERALAHKVSKHKYQEVCRIVESQKLIIRTFSVERKSMKILLSEKYSEEALKSATEILEDLREGLIGDE